MFPNPNDKPTGLAEPAICIGITSAVPFNLVGPIPLVCVWHTRPVLGAAVPEAAIDEHGDLRRAEH